MFFASAIVTGAEDVVVAAPGAGKRIVVLGIQITMGGAGIYEIYEGTPASATNRLAYGACASGIGAAQFIPFFGGQRLAVNTGLNGVTSAGNCYVNVHYIVETVA